MGNGNKLTTIFEPFSPILELTENVHVKIDYLFPSGSYKDRWSSFLCSKLKNRGLKAIVEDSSWNAWASLSLYAHKGEIPAYIFIPENTSPIKKEQIEKTNAKVYSIPWDREFTKISAIAFAKKEDIYYAWHTDNPYFIQWVKTLAYELYVQYKWKLPQEIIIPIWSGNLILWLYLGLHDLIKNGLISDFPKLIWVQSSSCSPIADYFIDIKQKKEENPKLYSLAQGICIKKPSRKEQIITAIRATKWTCLVVWEQDIQDSFDAALQHWLYLDYTAAATYAWVLLYLSQNPKRKILGILTGTWLKNPLS